MPDRAGVRIYNQFYPFVEQFRHGDPILIHEVTGLDWDTFSDMLAKAGDGSGRSINPIVQTALIAVAVQREHPTWSRREVAKFLNELELGSEEYVGGESDEEAEKLPPTESPATSSNSEEISEVSPASESSPSPTSSGDPGSDTTTPALRQIV